MLARANTILNPVGLDGPEQRLGSMWLDIVAAMLRIYSAIPQPQSLLTILGRWFHQLHRPETWYSCIENLYTLLTPSERLRLGLRLPRSFGILRLRALRKDSLRHDGTILSIQQCHASVTGPSIPSFPQSTRPCDRNGT